MRLLPSLLVRSATALDMTGLLAIRPDVRVHQERLAHQDDGEWIYLIAASPDVAGIAIIYGFVVLIWGGDEHHVGYPLLADLLVRDGFRGQRIGTRLMEHAESLCRERGLTQLGLSVNPADNPHAYSLYLRRGYTDTGQSLHCERTTLTDDRGGFEFLEDWCLCLTKTLLNEGPIPSPDA